MGVTPFFANYGFHSQPDIEPSGIYKGEWKVEFLATDEIIKKQAKIMIFMQTQLVWAQNEQTQFVNRDCQPYSEY